MPAHKFVTLAQERVLLQLMQENPHIAQMSGQLPPLAKQAVMLFWESVASKLNAMGPGTKAARKWRDYWTERKYGVRKKAAAMRAAGTGRLSYVEEQILQIIGNQPTDQKESQFGESSSSEAESPRPPVAATIPIALLSSLPSTPPPPASPAPPAASPPPPTVRPPSPLRENSVNRIITNAPTWAIDLENRRLDIQNRQLETQERLASAVERLATVAEKQSSAVEWLTSVAEAQNSAVERVATAAEVHTSALQRLATAAEASSELLQLLLDETQQKRL